MIGRAWIAATVVAMLLQAAATSELAARAARPARASSGFHVTGVPGGGVDCREMTGNLRKDPQSWGDLYSSYVAGFVTGANFVSYLANRSNTNVGSDVPTDTTVASVARYCEQNPTKKIHEAVEGVYSQLAARE